MDTEYESALDEPGRAVYLPPFPPPTPSPAVAPSPLRGRAMGVVALVAVAAGLVGGGIGAYAARHDGTAVTYAAAPSTTAAAAGSRPSAATTLGGIDVASIVARTTPSVVRIQSTTTGVDIFQQPVQQTGTGTGFVASADGLIYTNAHVVGDTEKVKVTMADGSTKDGRVVGTDSTDDLAVVKIDAKGLTPLPIGSSAGLRVGDPVVAVGNALALPGGPTATSGIVSALNRSIDTDNGEHLARMIQTDAAINPGNSGGPLLDAAGEVIGINTAGANNAENVGFAISLDTAAPILKELATGKPHVKAFLGVQTAAVDQSLAQRLGLSVQEGAYVQGVTADSAAELAGIQVGDVITRIDDTPITSPGDIGTVLGTHHPDDSVKVTVRRGNDDKVLTVTLGSHTA